MAARESRLADRMVLVFMVSFGDNGFVLRILVVGMRDEGVGVDRHHPLALYLC